MRKSRTYRRDRGGWVATRLEQLLDRAVELVGLGDDWHHPSCGRSWAPQSNHCHRYCGHKGPNRAEYQ